MTHICSLYAWQPTFNYFLIVTHLRLTEHLETVLADELQKLAVRKAEEFFFFSHLGQSDTEAHTNTFRKRHILVRNVYILDLIFLCCFDVLTNMSWWSSVKFGRFRFRDFEDLLRQKNMDTFTQTVSIIKNEMK